MKHTLAQQLSLPGGGAIQGPQGLDDALGGRIDIGGVLSRALPLVFIFAGVGLLLMLLAGGFTFLTSAGDAKKLEGGKQRLTSAIIGFIIIFAAFWIVQALGIIFNLDAINKIF